MRARHGLERDEVLQSRLHPKHTSRPNHLMQACALDSAPAVRADTARRESRPASPVCPVSHLVYEATTTSGSSSALLLRQAMMCRSPCFAEMYLPRKEDPGVGVELCVCGAAEAGEREGSEDELPERRRDFGHLSKRRNCAGPRHSARPIRMWAILAVSKRAAVADCPLRPQRIHIGRSHHVITDHPLLPYVSTTIEMFPYQAQKDRQNYGRSL